MRRYIQLRNYIDAAAFKEMILCANAALHANVQAINDLNVFPVPDGDTGTNMALTMDKAATELKKKEFDTIAAAADCVASALLRGARGNSGVILSLLFRGISKRLKGLDTAGAQEFAGAMQDGVDAAYKAVMKPAEGTILTVSRMAAAAAVEAANAGASLESCLDCAIKAGNDALAETVNQNPVLKKAGVIDAGGQGYMYILGAMLASYRGEITAPENVDELMFGCILTAAQGQNVARQVSIKAGIPYSVPAYTVGMVCGSGMKSVIEGARSILAGDSDIVVCGGTENMSAAPFASMDARWGARMGDKKLVDTMIKDGLWDAYNNYHMGTTAENINDIWGITRREQDEFAAASQQKAEAAQASGRFDDEIVPVMVKVKKDMVPFAKDEYPKAGVTADSIAKLKGAFPVGPESPNPQVVHTFEVTGAQDAADKGTQRVTAANASGINDGAAAIVLASGEAVEKYGLKPMAKLIGWGQGGVDPKIMGVGPVVASRNAMKKAGVTIDDIDLIEANEAFAAQSIAVARELHFDMSKVNVNGGAIALGHPVGASGARIIVTLLHEMQKRPEAKKGLATLCIGGGMGTAVVFEKC